MRALTLLLVLVFAAPLCLAEDNANQAIDDALLLLQGRRERLTERGERDKLQRAIDELKTVRGGKAATAVETRRVPVEEKAAVEERGAVEEPVADEKPKLDVPIADFIDNTQRYKGQVVTLPLVVRSRSLIQAGQTLRDLKGSSARFLGFSEEGNRVDVMIDLPQSSQVPKVSFGDRVIVSFRCSEGELMRGNVATAIRRPAEQVSQPQD